jgi:hypothetical protein
MPLLSILYQLVRCLLGLAAVLVRRDLSKDVELLVLRHEKAVLCQLGTPPHVVQAIARHADLSAACVRSSRADQARPSFISRIITSYNGESSNGCIWPMMEKPQDT